jgi:hypothetical protein
MPRPEIGTRRRHTRCGAAVGGSGYRTYPGGTFCQTLRPRILL